MLECKIGCLGPQRGRLRWATQQIMNDGWSFACRLMSKNLSRKFSVVYDSCFELQVSLCYS